MVDLYNEIGARVDGFFTNLTQASYQEGLIYVTGRDLVVFIAGGLTMFVAIVLLSLIEDAFNKKKNNRGKQ